MRTYSVLNERSGATPCVGLKEVESRVEAGGGLGKMRVSVDFEKF